LQAEKYFIGKNADDPSLSTVHFLRGLHRHDGSNNKI
jgi:hypothetical protein